MPRNEDGPSIQIDLHGLMPADALRRIAQGLHSARVHGDKEILLITGRGLSNPDGEAVLRTRVEHWLDGQEGQGYGVHSHERTHKGGALLVKLS